MEKLSYAKASDIKKQAQHYIAATLREIQYQCNQGITDVAQKIKHHNEVLKKHKVTLKSKKEMLKKTEQSIAKKKTKANAAKQETLKNVIKELESMIKRLTKEVSQLKSELDAIKDLKKQEQARAVFIKSAKLASSSAKKAASSKTKKSSKELIHHVLGHGHKAPTFSVFTQRDGKDKISLKDFKGQSVVLYFYPKDNTPGCTHQANDFSQQLKKFKKLNTVVLGVSRDSIASHTKFIEKFSLKHSLLSDADEAMCQSYGVIKNKNMYGRQVRGIERTTFLIDGKGVIQKIWRGVKVQGHVDEVLSELK